MQPYSTTKQSGTVLLVLPFLLLLVALLSAEHHNLGKRMLDFATITHTRQTEQHTLHRLVHSTRLSSPNDCSTLSEWGTVICTSHSLINWENLLQLPPLKNEAMHLHLHLPAAAHATHNINVDHMECNNGFCLLATTHNIEVTHSLTLHNPTLLIAAQDIVIATITTGTTPQPLTLISTQGSVEIKNIQGTILLNAEAFETIESPVAPLESPNGIVAPRTRAVLGVFPEELS